MKINPVLQTACAVLAALPVRGKERMTRPVLSRLRGDHVVSVDGIKILLTPPLDAHP